MNTSLLKKDSKKTVATAAGSGEEGPAIGMGMLRGLMEHRVSAAVKDLDHYRVRGLMALDTDYIIHVQCKSNASSSKGDSTK